MAALQNTDKPTALILSRQGLPNFERDKDQINSIIKGGYIIHEPKEKPSLVLIATGSEVELAMEIANDLMDKKHIRVVSMPCTERFDAQSESYKQQIEKAKNISNNINIIVDINIDMLESRE